MEIYKVERVREKEVTQNDREAVKDGVYAVESGTGLVYIGQDGRLKRLENLDRNLEVVYKITKEDISKIYNLYSTPSGYSFDDEKNFGSDGVARLIVHPRKIELKDRETKELLNPYDYGIFATSDFDIVRPVKKLEPEDPFNGIIDRI